MTHGPKFEVAHGDVADVEADVLVLKHAGGRFYGADKAVAERLAVSGGLDLSGWKLGPDDYRLVPSGGALVVPKVLFLGTVPLYALDYGAIGMLARRCVAALAEEGVQNARVAGTIHGPGFGLDPVEVVQWLMAGFRGGAAEHPGVVDSVVFIERSEPRVDLIRQALGDGNDTSDPAATWGESLAGHVGVAVGAVSAARVGDAIPGVVGAIETTLRAIRAVGKGTPGADDRIEEKPHIFVAMPFSDEFEDVYRFGILEPVRRCGFACEKVDEVSFTGDVLQQIKNRIASSRLVIAELTGARPNVYLEVGYAWGCGKEVVFLAKKGEQIHFDVATQRTIFYRNITHLAEELQKLIEKLSPTSRMG